MDSNNQRSDIFSRSNLQMQKMIDELKDENVTLKLRVADIEGDLLEERETKQVRYDVTLETIKSQLQEQYLDQKVRMEEEVIG